MQLQKFMQYSLLGVFLGAALHCFAQMQPDTSRHPSDTTTKAQPPAITIPVSIAIDKQGKLTEPWNKALPVDAPLTCDTTAKVVVSIIPGDLSPEPFNTEKIYALLLKTAQAEIDSLDKNANGIRDQYQQLMKGNYWAAYDEIKTIRDFLADPKHDPGKDPEAVLIKSIIDTLHSGFTNEGHFDARRQQVEVDIKQEDPTRFFLLGWYNAHLTQLTTLKPATPDGKKARKDLLAAYRSADLILQGEKTAGPLVCRTDSDYLTRIEQVIQSLKDADLSGKLATDDFIKQTLWINGGVFRINPLLVRPVINLQKAALYDGIIQQKVDSIAHCCENDATKIEALVKAMGTGAAKFKVADGSTILGYKNWEDVLKAYRIVNRILIPTLQEKRCCCPGYPHPYDNRWVISYDASSNYRVQNPCIDPAVMETEEVVVAVNNIPENKNVTITAGDETVADQSKAQAALASVGTDLSGVASTISPVAAVLPAFLSQISPPPSPTDVAVQPSAVTYTKEMFSNSVMLNSLRNSPNMILHVNDSIKNGYALTVTIFTKKFTLKDTGPQY